MKVTKYKNLLLLFIATIALSSCEIIGGIFKTGTGFGAILVIMVIALIVFIISKVNKK